MSRMTSIALPAAALLAAAAVAGCGGSSSDETTSAAATTAATTEQVETTTTNGTTTTETTTTDKNQTYAEKKKNVKNISDAEINSGGYHLGKSYTMNAANGGTLKVTFKKGYDPVKSITDYDVAPKGSRFVGVTLDAEYSGPTENVTTTVFLNGSDGSKLAGALIADPDCGRNLVNLSLLGTELGKKGCIVAVAPNGVKPKSVTIVLRSGATENPKNRRSVTVPL